ncbi:chromosomal replication initiator DnaA [Rhodobacteraceae bacterium NNCM2]|nr:chromosomal replication initiator DnaA [Coraliihabitans acroporae]
MVEQLSLDLPVRTALSQADYLVSGSNALAVEMVENWADWPRGRLALIGPPRAGKTHLAHVWAHLASARVVAAGEVAGQDPVALSQGAVAVEDVDRLADLAPDTRAGGEAALFHLYNLMGEAGSPLLLTGVAAPVDWRIALPDLRSRLSSVAIAEIAPPDDMLLSSLLVKLFADRQLLIDPKVISYMIRRMERSCAAVEELVALIDTTAMEKKRRITRSLVQECTGWKD